MSSQQDSIPSSWKKLLNSEIISRSISRISYEIVEKDRNFDKLAIVGIRTGGEIVSRRIHSRIEEIEGKSVYFGLIDITLYRDDLSNSASQPILRGTELPFPISGSRIVLVDDVLFTGRTVRAALDAIIDFGRPECVELAVLVDRGHRELPIRPDFVGKNLPSKKEEVIRVKFTEQGLDEGVYLVKS